MTSKRADLYLFLITLAWGVSWILMDVLLREMPPFALNSTRFIASFLLIFAFQRGKLLGVNGATLKASLLIGVILFVVYVGATLGVKYTTLTNAAFLSCLQVILVPVFGLLLFGNRVRPYTWFFVAVALVGIGLMTLTSGFTIGGETVKGDLLSLLCSAGYALHLLITERVVRNDEVDPGQLGAYQMLVAGLIHLMVSLAFEDFTLPASPGGWGAWAFLTVFCTALSFMLQPFAQKYTSATHVGVIYSMEPLIAGITAWLFLGEIMSGQKILGAFLIVSSVIIMEVGPPKWLSKKFS
ncbi:MAG: DMT family transporter [Tissierellia bacterium]|nr:DMT family transporter [Tissierellia bacterium]